MGESSYNHENQTRRYNLNPSQEAKPLVSFVKMNSDGTCVGDSSEGGGLVRDLNNNCLMVFILHFGTFTRNLVEVKVFLFRLNHWYWDWQLSKSESFSLD